MVTRGSVIARSALALCDEAISNTIKRLLRAQVPRPHNDIFIFLLSTFLLVSCTTNAPPSTPQVVSVYSSTFTQPWLTELYDCAAESDIVIRLSASPAEAEIHLRIGEPEVLTSFAYQIDEEQILIVTNRVSPVQNLTREQAQALFMGLGDPSVQLWVYASDADGQRVFDQFVMEGRSVASLALIAVSPQHMSDTLVSQPNAVGILPRHWKAGDVREVYAVATVPVLALTDAEPQGLIKELIACLQK